MFTSTLPPEEHTMSDYIDEQRPLGFPDLVFNDVDADDVEPVPIPTTREALRRFIKDTFDLAVPDVRTCPHHQTPMDYLVASVLDQRDLLVWASRAGGKTFLAAVATLLDAAFRSPLSIRVLGGSFDQSDRLAEYIRDLAGEFPNLLAEPAKRDAISLVGGSEIRILPQSQRAVRGQHVQRIRCDEVELFDAEVWQAVQFATQSTDTARGSIEVLSTLHRVGGLMDQLVQSANRGESGYDLIRWCLWEVIERCDPAQRDCSDCPLAEDCIPAAQASELDIPDGQGVARMGEGHFRIEDAITIKSRSSRASWETEMLCVGVRNDWAVFGEFDPTTHVRPVPTMPDWPTYRAIDFGYRDPLVCLWVQLGPAGEIHVIDEYVRTQQPITYHSQEILRRDPARIAGTYVDPAGNQTEATSGQACTELLAAAGIPCTWRASSIVDGIELIRAALAPAGGDSTLAIHPRCRQLVEAFGRYHYPPAGSGKTHVPVKDGPDHLIDALRYFFVNRCRPGVAIRQSTY
jgi:hypothetical protein